MLCVCKYTVLVFCSAYAYYYYYYYARLIRTSPAMLCMP